MQIDAPVQRNRYEEEGPSKLVKNRTGKPCVQNILFNKKSVNRRSKSWTAVDKNRLNLDDCCMRIR